MTFKKMKNNIYYRNCVKELEFLKKPVNETSYLASHIPIENGGYLVPLTYNHLENDQIINTLLDWRISHIYAYPSRNIPTFDSTKNWLKKYVLDNPNKILFLIYDQNHLISGHAGFADIENSDRKLEFDNILRGEEKARKGIMSDAIKSLQNWAEKILYPNSFYLKVLKSNNHAVNFYKSLGFIETKKIGLIKDEVNNLIISNLEKDQYDDYFLVMEPTYKKIGEKMILTAGPSIGGMEKFYALDAAANGWNNQWNKYLSEFEKKFAEYIGVKYAIATSSCTGALHIALNALGIGPGDEVIVPEITWVASANAIMYVGATPIFAEIDKKTWNICPNNIEKLITNNTKAIIPVHLYGNPCDMKPIMDIANKYNLKIVEDAAPSIGAEYQGKKTGSFGDFSAFSFQGAKLAVTGEGGMLCTNDEELYKKAYRIWDQGRIPGSFWIEELGVKYKMSNIQAALGIGQLSRNEAMVDSKRKINSWYKERLSKVDCIDFWEEKENTKCIYWMTNIRLNEKSKISREKFLKLLKDRNIDTRPVFPAISQYPYWPKKQNPQVIANLIGESGINLPSGVGLIKKEIDYICDNIIEILNS